MTEEWKIQKRKSQCATCSREFESEETHYSGIQEMPETFVRVDTCLACWKKEPPTLFSYWQTQNPSQEERKIENTQGMIDFFNRLTAESLEQPTRKKVTYLVSLLLMRRRKIKLITTSKGWLQLEKAWDGESIKIPDPQIQEDELDSLKEEMERLFQGEPVSTS